MEVKSEPSGYCEIPSAGMTVLIVLEVEVDPTIFVVRHASSENGAG
jgi:hypothetical protein